MLYHLSYTRDDPLPPCRPRRSTVPTASRGDEPAAGRRNMVGEGFEPS